MGCSSGTRASVLRLAASGIIAVLESLALVGPALAEEDLVGRDQFFREVRSNYPSDLIPFGARLRALRELERNLDSGILLSDPQEAMVYRWHSVSAPIQGEGDEWFTGRVTALAVDPTSGGHVVYAGSANGGVWRGQCAPSLRSCSWEPLTDNGPAAKSLAIGTIAVSSDGQTIYAGTGEANQTCDGGYFGAGLLRSADAGATWELVGQDLAGMAISKIIIWPGDTHSEVIFVSTLVGQTGFMSSCTTPSGGDPQPGVWLSKNGGESFVPPGGPIFDVAPEDTQDQVTDLVLTGSDATTATLLAGVMARSQNDEWAGVWKLHFVNMTGTPSLSPYPDSPVFQFCDAGNCANCRLDCSGTYNQHTMGRIELADDPSTPSLTDVYAVMELSGVIQPVDQPGILNHGQGVYRTIDGGSSWYQFKDDLPDTSSCMSEYVKVESDICANEEPPCCDAGEICCTDPDGKQRPCRVINVCEGQCQYDLVLEIDCSGRLWLGGIGIWRTIAQPGTSLDFDSYCDDNVHVDQHALAFSPGCGYAFLGNDGGVLRADLVGPPVDGRWEDANGNELTITQFYPRAGTYASGSYRWLLGPTQDLGVVRGRGYWPLMQWSWDQSYWWSDGSGAAMADDQLWWAVIPKKGFLTTYGTWDAAGGDAPDVIPNFEHWSKLRDRSQEAPYGNLAAVCKKTMGDYLMMIAHDTQVTRTLKANENPTIMSWDDLPDSPFTAKVTAVAFSGSAGSCGTYYVGLADGTVARTTDDFATSDFALDAGESPGRRVVDVVPDPTNQNIVYVTFGGFGGPHLYRTNNALEANPSWTPLGDALPDTPLNSILVKRDEPAMLFAATDVALFRSPDRGLNWQRFMIGHPRSPVYALAQDSTGTLYSFTHGRGAFAITGPMGGELIFADDFEWGDTCAWSRTMVHNQPVDCGSLPDRDPSGFEVLDYQNGDPALSHPVVGDEVATIRLTNGNARFTDRDALPVPGSMPLLAERVFDSASTVRGYFGRGWSSLLDARITAGGAYQLRVVDEAGRATIFLQQQETGAFNQVWPSDGPRGQLVRSQGLYEYTDPEGRIRRSFSTSNRRLVRIADLPSGQAVEITYESGLPVRVSDSRGAWSWGLTVDPATWRVTAVDVDGSTWSYEYEPGQGLLTGVRLDGEVWRTYHHDAEGRLTAAEGPASRSIATFGYQTAGDHAGFADSLSTATTHVESVEYDLATPSRPLKTGIGEHATRVHWSSAVQGFTDCFIRPQLLPPVDPTLTGRGESSEGTTSPQRTVEIRGPCDCAAGSELTVFGYQDGRLARMQDNLGSVTVWNRDDWGRITAAERGHAVAGCDTQDPTPDACWVEDTDQLMALDLASEDALSTTWYTYGDPSWPNKAIAVCRPSVLSHQPTDLVCQSLVYDPLTAALVSTTTSGWIWDHALEEPRREERVTSRRLYTAGQTAADAFDPTAVAAAMGVSITFEPTWVSALQPAGLLREVNGPLGADGNGKEDRYLLVYYPDDPAASPPVPGHLVGRVAAVMDPAGEVTFYDDYGAFGLATRVVEPDGTFISLELDALGRVATRTLEGFPTGACDTTIDPLCSTDLVTQYRFDPVLGPLTRVTSPRGSEVSYGYDGWSRVTSVARGPAGQEAERIVSAYSSEGRSWGARLSESFQENVAGSWVERRRTELGYDESGRLDQATFPALPEMAGLADTAVEQYVYGPGGDLLGFKDAVHAGDPDPNVLYTHDILGRLGKVRQLERRQPGSGDPVWATTSYAYDANDTMTSVTDAIALTTSYDVDDFGQTFRVTSPATGERRLSYDVAGQLVGSVEARGAEETRSYAASGQLLEVVSTLGDSSETATYTYDNGRRATATSDGSSERWSYERRGLVSEYEVDAPGRQRLVLHYDEDGNLILRKRGVPFTIDSCEEVKYQLDYAGRPLRITATPAECGKPEMTFVHSVAYRPFGPPITILRSGETVEAARKVIETFDYDQRYRLIDQKAKRGGSFFLKRQYQHDGNGNLLHVRDLLDSTRDRDYSFDDLGRLVTAEGPLAADGGRATIGYSYDAAGNRLSRTFVDASGETLEEYGYGPSSGRLDQLTITDQAGSQGFELLYDRAGNLTRYAPLGGGTGEMLTYGPRGTLLEHQSDTGWEFFKYIYNADGLRVRTEGEGLHWQGVLHYLLLPDGTPFYEKAITWYGGVGGTRSYVFFGDRMVGHFDSQGSAQHVFDDPLGFPLAVADPAGQLLWKAEAEPFGAIASISQGSSGADPLLRYPGQWQQYDVGEPKYLDLFANGYRWYNPAWGRYTGPDPVDLATLRLPQPGMPLPERALLRANRAMDPRKLNPYAYAVGEPLLFTDSDGRQALSYGLDLRRIPANGALLCAEDALACLASCEVASFCSEGGTGAGWRQEAWVSQLFPTGESVHAQPGAQLDADLSRSGCSCAEQCLGSLRPATRVGAAQPTPWPDLLLWAGGWRLGMGY